MPFSVRFDPETEALIERLARTRGQTRSSVVREAVARYAAEEDDQTTLYDRIKPYIGTIRSGRSDLSQHTGRKVAELLRKRHTARQRAERARRSR
jgi:predicted transcriptional regulator